MKRKIFLVLAMVIVGTVFLGLLGACTKTPKTNFEVWGTYNTVKVNRQTTANDKYQKLDAKLDVEMMQDEYEGGQIVLTTENEATYKLEAGNLTSAEGNKFPLANIAVYHQRYIQVVKNNSGNPSFPSGSYIPDMLMPMATAIEYKENVIPANSNQGISVEFNSAGVPAGTYTGNFTLTVNDQTREIPVSVTVWDFGYQGRRTFQSSFLLYRDELLAGEYDTSDEMVQTYEDFFNQYKIDIYTIKDAGSRTIEEYVDFAERMYQSNNTASIIVPVDFPRGYVAFNGDRLTSVAQTAVNYILALAEISTLEDMYTDLLYFYPSSYDEADINGYDESAEAFFAIGGEYDKTIQAAVDAIDTDARFADMSAELKAALKQSIAKIPAAFTNVGFIDKWVGKMSAAFCPYSSLFNDQATAQKYQDSAIENAYGELWIYTCMGPTYPYGTFHIDDGTLGMRVSGWMEKAHNITGYLYYAVNFNTQFRLTAEEFTDMYNNPLRYETTPGDGYLVYPGRYYGSSTPFATVRLVSYRDSQDDYDMLCVYENLLKEYATEYGIDVDVNDYVADLYAKLFAGATHYNQDSLIYEARRELASRITALKDSGIIVKTDKTQTTVYAPDSATVKVDGTAVTGQTAGQGKAYVVSQDNDHSVEVAVDGATQTISVGKVVSLVAQSNITVSEGSTATLNDGIVSVSLKSQYRGNDGEGNVGAQTRMFNPYVGFKASGILAGDTIKFSYTNNATEDMEFSVMVVDNTGKRTAVITNYCPQGTTRDVSIVLSEQLLAQLKIDVSTIAEIRLSFTNVVNNANGTVSLHPDRDFVVTDVRIEK